MPKLRFTTKRVKALPIHEKGTAYYHDSEARGLCLSVSYAGRRTFVVYRRIHGKPVRLIVGPHPELTIEEARARASEINAAVARGENPPTGARTIPGQMTLVELFNEHLERHAKVHKCERGWREDVGLFRRYLHAWRFRRIGDTRRVELVDFHARIGRTAP